jgi:hypothetical protein
MQRNERLLYHQIHPLKLTTDVATAISAGGLFWMQHAISALLIGFLPSIAVTVALLRFADLERYRVSAFGRYVGRFMSRRVEVARLAGLLPLWGGAWLRRPGLIALGVVWIIGCWLLGFVGRDRHDSTL